MRVLAVPEDWNLALLGGRGGGKTTCAAFVVLRHCVQYGDRARPLLVRETYKSLTQLEEELEGMLSVAFPEGVQHNRTDHVFRLPNGAVVELGQLDGPQAYGKFQGRETTLLLVDEFTNFRTDRYVNQLRANLRAAPDVPLRMVVIGNPGGPMHAQVARRHVNGRMAWRPYEIDGETWVTCPSVYTDNPHIDQARYARQITAAAGNDRVLAEAWLCGRWDEIRGAFFADVWGEHLLFSDRDWKVPPETWRSFVALDWGWSAPSVVLYVAQPRGQGYRGPTDRVLPQNSYVVLDELATARPDDPTEGLGWPPSMLAEETLARCERWRVKPTGVGDDARGLDGSTLLEQFRSHGLSLERPKKDRVSGWVKMKQLMANTRDDNPDKPGLWISERCRYLLETMPVLPRNEIRPEDVDTMAADHGADALRYAVAHEPRTMRFGRTIGTI